ncbi:MAG: ATP-binding protein [Candidatus Korarchaeota archaeon]|nr:ATP-binding protein [Candidatus Korarchaeota archaeon]
MYFSLGVKSKRDDFYDMEAELDSLISELLNPISRMVVVKGIRRTGKSSLVRVSLSELDLPYVLIDLRLGGSISPEDIYSYLSDELSRLLEQERGIKKFLSKIREVEIAGFRIEISRRSLSTVGKLVGAFNEWAESEGTYLVMAFDEAQDLRLIRGFSELLAHIYDYEERIKLLLAGSEVGLLDRLLGREDPSSPLFGRAYAEIQLKKFPRERSLDFLAKGFEQVGISPPLRELEEAVDKLDGIVGWLTYYGYHRMRMEHEDALERTIHEGASLAARELENFLSIRGIARKRYVEVLRILMNPSRWSDVKRGLAIALGTKISDKQITTYLRELVEYGFVEKRDGLYELADPLLVEAVRRGLVR